MLKDEERKIADSNIANLGTQLERDCKIDSAKGEKAWKGVGQKVGHHIWRIEAMKVVKSQWREGEAATFYNGDAYIILNSYKKEDKLLHDVHFWLGSESSQDEQGVAAYKTVELDTLLGDLPVQHRETEGHESKLMLSYYNGDEKAGMQILKGGVASGFNHVEPESYKPRLLQLKGKKHIRVTQVDTAASSLTCDDVYVFDAGLDIYQWQGAKSGKNEIAYAGRFCQALDDERKGKPEKHVYRQGDKDESEFFKAMGIDEVPEITAEGPDDAKWEHDDTTSMWKLSDASGKMECTKLDSVSKDNLNSDDVFIIDVGCQVICWVGKNASAMEKKKSIVYAAKYLLDNGRPAHLPISSVLEGADNRALEAAF